MILQATTMGKVKRGRRKFHIQTVKSDQQEKDDSLRTNEVPQDQILCVLIDMDCKKHWQLFKLSQTDLLPVIFPSAGLFKFTAKTAGSGIEEEKSIGGKVESSQDNKPTSKKDRRKERHERFLRSKINIVKLL